MLSRHDLAALATPVYGSEWQSALARERGVAVRTVQRWAKDGIAKPETAMGVRAYLLSRRIIDVPAPPSDAADERDDAGYAIATVLLQDVVGAWQSVGWLEAEMLGAMLSAIVDRMIAGAGAPATAETLKEVQRQVLDQVAR